MRKILLWFAIVLLLAGYGQTAVEKTVDIALPTVTITPTATPCHSAEGEHMASYTKYLSTSNSDYRGMYESTGSVDGYSYGYVGNKDNLVAFWLAYKLPTDFPHQGGLIGTYTVNYADITSATLRLPEVSGKGSRGNAVLNLKISPLTGPWNASAAFNTIPAWNHAVVQTYVHNYAIPSSSNYDTRYGYHAAQYKYEKSTMLNGVPYEFVGYVYLSSYQGSYYSDEEYIYLYESTIPAYYDYYYKYRDINVTDIVKEMVHNGATGILLWFEYSGDTTYNRKVFTTVEETADSRRPAIFITFTEGSGAPNVKMVVGEPGSKEFKQLAGLKMVVGEPGSKEWKELAGLKMVVGEPGSKEWVDIY